MERRALRFCLRSFCTRGSCCFHGWWLRATGKRFLFAVGASCEGVAARGRARDRTRWPSRLRSRRPWVSATLTFPGAAGRRPWKTVRRTGCQGPVLSLRRYISSCDSQGLAAGPSAVPCSGCGLVGEVTGCHARVWAQRLDVPHGCRSRCEHGCGEISWRKRGRVCPVKAAVCLHVSVPPRWHPSQLSQRPTPASARAVSGVRWTRPASGHMSVTV